MPKALLLENIHPDALALLRDRGFEVETRDTALDEQELIDTLDDLDDLQNIYPNWTSSDEVMAQREAE